jgi:hypothetical protein
MKAKERFSRLLQEMIWLCRHIADVRASRLISGNDLNRHMQLVAHIANGLEAMAFGSRLAEFFAQSRDADL